MAQLKSLNFTPLPKHTSADPVMHRRNKLITRLQQQISLAQDPSFTLTRQKFVTDEQGIKQLRETKKRVRAWWRTDGAGNVVLQVLYGARPIEWSKGMHGIMVGKKDRLISTLEQVIEAVQSGDCDTILGQMSKTAVQAKGKKAA